MALFQPIDLETWKRAPYYLHFYEQTRCTYSLTTNLNITALLQHAKSKGVKLYPILLYALTQVVNRHEEFRTTINKDGVLGFWQESVPSYTIFHPSDETFSTLWTESRGGLEEFLVSYASDMATYGHNSGLCIKPEMPESIFHVSSLPWTTFTSFNINVFSDGSYLLPIFTWGKYVDNQGECLIPLAVQVHHAVCDGFHVSRLISELQEQLDGLALEISSWK